MPSGHPPSKLQSGLAPVLPLWNPSKPMETRHQVLVSDARDMGAVPDGSVHLVVTSPPYPMIEMWDGVFSGLAPGIGEALATGNGEAAFDRMHAELDRAWQECRRVLVPGGLACINIGDATRTIGGDFRLFPNHARITLGMGRAGLTALPDIIWRKPTNAPNKFMGSGMLPAGAYVTYEHEYILVFRKGAKRSFEREHDKAARRRSAYFWEERNTWFSDVWMDLVGTRQALADPGTRARSAAFPLEIPYRLIHMYSVAGDTVLDPFAGIGTTTVAAIAGARNSIAIERDPALAAGMGNAVSMAPRLSAERAAARLRAHNDFLEGRIAIGKPPKHENLHFGFPVVTRQEIDLVLYRAESVARRGPGSWIARHSLVPAEASGHALELPFAAADPIEGP